MRVHSSGSTGRFEPPRMRLDLIVVVALIALALVPATAFAATTFTNPFPVPDSTVIGSPYGMSAEVQADSAILTSTKIAVDGVNLTAYVDWPGHWEDPDCMEVWIVDDYTKATVSAGKPEGFSAGMHTVVMTVNTASSGTATYTWSFTVTYPADQLATFSLMNPSPNTTATSLPMMRVTIESTNTISGYNADLFIDGVVVNHTYNQPNTKKLILFSLAQVQMTDGPHTARAAIFDSLRIFSEYSWSFNVQARPTVTVVAPASATTVNVAKPPIRINATDNTPGPVRIVLKLDGAQVFDGMAPQGAFRWDPTQGFVSGTTHTVRADVYDAAGNTSAVTWSFNVQAAPPMSTRNDCTSCHVAAEHPFTNCTGCHQDDPLYDPHDANRFGPVGPCYDCHGTGYTHSISPDCAYCHANTQWLQIPRHDAAAVDAKHVKPNPGCDACHSTSIVDEHAKYPAASTFKFQCAVCHTSTRPEVIAAIAANDVSCVACHEGVTASDRHGFSVAPVNYATACRKCHDQSLAGTHPYHNGEANCGASCHPGWGASSGSSIPRYLDTYGVFATPTSQDASASSLHVIHSKSTWPAGIDTSVSKCGSCHAVAACAACHDGTVSSAHANHASTMTSATAWTGSTSRGVDEGDQLEDSHTVTETVRCGGPLCHDTDHVSDASPWFLEDRSHAASTTYRYLANTVATTGTWRVRSSQSYSAGQQKQSNIAGSTLSVGFTGQQIAILADNDPYRGIAEVLIDGVSRGDVDLYSDTTRNQVEVFRSGVLAPGAHTITVKVKGTKDVNARATTVSVDRFDVYERPVGSIAPACSGCH